MATRPREHVLEEESNKAFEFKIPSEWVIRPHQPDYGIDKEVQIFENGMSTPYIFFVQLKSTDKIKLGNYNPSFSFSTERLREYQQYPLPVLLILFDANKKKLFYKWTHDFFGELDSETERKLKTQKTLSVNFVKEIEENCSDILAEEVKEYFYRSEKQPENSKEIKVKLDLNLNDNESKKIETELKEWLWQNKKLHFIKIGNFENADFLISGVTEWGAITVISKSKRIAYPFIEDSQEIDFVALLLSSLKIVIADSLAFSGRINTSLDIITQFFLDECLTNSTANFILEQHFWAFQYAQKNRSLEALEIADKLIETRNYKFAYIFAFALNLNSLPQNINVKKYQEFLKKSVKFAKENRDKGIQSYNLGNSLRGANSFRNAIIQFCKAAKYEPKYLEKSYWWGEIAGCFFLLNKFRWAERCYRKSIELGEKSIQSRFLLADSLLFQGKFEEASKEFEIYLNETKVPFAQAVLKRWLADFLLAKFGNTKRNPVKSQEFIEKAINLENVEEQGKAFYEALKQDPISDLAWYNFRVFEDTKLNLRDFETWLASVITNPEDIFSWVYFVFLLFSEFSEANEEFSYFHLAILDEAWRNEAKIEDEIRNRIPESYAISLFESIKPLVEDARLIFLHEQPFLLREF